MKPIDIANLFKISKQIVNYHIHHGTDERKARRTKLNRNEKNLIIKWAKDRPISLASAKKLQRRFNYLSKEKKEKGIQKRVSLSTINRTLNKGLSKPKQIKKVFFLSSSKKFQRLKFLQFMKQNNISPDKIFFTDESIFNLSSFFNRNYKIRLSKQTQKKINRGDECALQKITREFPKKENGVMVSGGICRDGLGKLIFHSGNINSFAYKQVLQFYREDMDVFHGKIFQQDGARAHSSKSSQKEIRRLFEDNFIPTWESGPEITEKFPRWPPNSPDLSAIELVWSIIKGMMNIFPPRTMEELKLLIKKVWDSIPKEMCERIINHIKKRWDLCIKHKGRRLDKQLLKKISSTKNNLRLKLAKSKINGVRISYNDKFVLKLKNKDIRERNKKIKEQIKIENTWKAKWNKLMKLKPNEYKNIPDKTKKDIKFNLDHETARRELMQENLEEIQKKSIIEYLDVLNEKTKEKLIGLCLDKKILEAFESDEFIEEENTEGIEDDSYALGEEEEEESI